MTRVENKIAEIDQRRPTESEVDRAMTIVHEFQGWNDATGPCPIEINNRHWFKKLCAMGERMAKLEAELGTALLPRRTKNSSRSNDRLNEYAIGGCISEEGKAVLAQLLVRMGMCASMEDARENRRIDLASLKAMMEARPAQRLVLYAMNTHSGDLLKLCRMHMLEIRIFSRSLGPEQDHWVSMYMPKRRLANGGIRRPMDAVFMATDNGKAVVGGAGVEERLRSSESKNSFERLAGDMNLASHIEAIHPLVESAASYAIKDIASQEDAEEFQAGSQLPDVVPTWRIVHAHGGSLFGLCRDGRQIGVFSLRKDEQGKEQRAIEISVGGFGIAEEEAFVIDAFIAERAEQSKLKPALSPAPGM